MPVTRSLSTNIWRTITTANANHARHEKRPKRNKTGQEEMRTAQEERSTKLRRNNFDSLIMTACINGKNVQATADTEVMVSIMKKIILLACRRRSFYEQ